MPPKDQARAVLLLSQWLAVGAAVRDAADASQKPTPLLADLIAQTAEFLKVDNG